MNSARPSRSYREWKVGLSETVLSVPPVLMRIAPRAGSAEREDGPVQARGSPCSYSVTKARIISLRYRPPSPPLPADSSRSRPASTTLSRRNTFSRETKPQCLFSMTASRQGTPTS